jgi:hypothetical protein
MILHLLIFYSFHGHFLQIIFGGQDDQNRDTNYDSDEAESKLSVPQPEDSVDGNNFADMLLQLSDAPKEGNQGCGESGLDTHEEKSLAESVGSLNLGRIDSDSADSTPLLHSKESCCSSQSASDLCSRTRSTKCSLSSEESDSISSRLAFDGGENDLELEAPPVSEMINDGHVKPIDHSVPRNVEIFADGPNNGIADPQKDTGILDPHCDALTPGRESACSSSEEPRFGLNGESSSSGCEEPRHDSGKLPMVSEGPANSTEPRMNNTVPVTGTANDSTSREPNEDDAGDESVHESEDIAKSSTSPHKAEDDAPKSGKGVLKSVAGRITLFGAVLFIVHLRCEPEFEVKFVDRHLV